MTSSHPDFQPVTESAAFAKAYPHLDLDQIPDPWGRPIFKHSHVRALWEGWFARACLDDDRAQCGVQSREAIAAVIDPVAFDPISLGDTHPGWLHRREVALETAGKILALGNAQAPDDIHLLVEQLRGENDVLRDQLTRAQSPVGWGSSPVPSADRGRE